MKEKINFNRAVYKTTEGDYFIEPTCNFLAINFEYQRDEIIAKNDLLKNDRRKSCDENLFGDKKMRLTLSKKGYTFWVLQLNPLIIGVEKQDIFKQFQSEILEFLWSNTESSQNKMEDIQAITIELHKLYTMKTGIQKKVNALNKIKNKMLETTPDEWALIRNDYMGQLEMFADHKQLNM